jgi:hypothetical protein
MLLLVVQCIAGGVRVLLFGWPAWCVLQGNCGEAELSGESSLRKLLLLLLQALTRYWCTHCVP